MRASNLKNFVVGFAVAAVSGVAMANEGTFTIGQTGLVYTSTSSTTKPDGGTEAKETTTGFSTMPTSFYGQATWDNMSVYVFPANPFMPLWVSYMPMKELEVGVRIGLDSKKEDKAKKEEAMNKFGLFGIYYVEAGPGTVEANFSFESHTTTSKTTTVDATTGASAEVKTNDAATEIVLGADYVYPVNKRFYYVGGVSYTMATTDVKEGNKRKTTANTLGLNLMSIRFVW